MCIRDRQGDPLAPLLFAAALQPLASDLRAGAAGRPPPDLSLFYLDDGLIAGDLPAVAAALARLQAECPSLGLELNLD
eukprot:6504580-Alexandrium_andersonii.AAC.1